MDTVREKNGSYTYDTLGRMATHTTPKNETCTYTYDQRNRQTLADWSSSTPDTAKTYFANGLIKSIDNGVSKSDYIYNTRNQLTSETQTLSGQAAHVVSYGYDSDGLRTGTTYTYDLANQVTAAFSRSVGVPPTSGTINYTANTANQYTRITGLTPITHEANGNLLQQNGVTYTWDSENRLLSVTPSTPALGDKSLIHTYDGQHRRVTRTVKEWTTSGWTSTETTHFIYDGWNVIEEYSWSVGVSPTLQRTRVWGNDISGSPQSAGGVGGLLLTEEITSTTTTAYHFAYDGNGNVTEITDASANPAASYRYDAFGNTLVATGTYATANKYRFSTKPLDSEVTNAPLYYYGYRYYDPLTGRWPSRDPIEERGGINLYGFVRNNGINKRDYLGLVGDPNRCCDAKLIAKGKEILEEKYKEAVAQFKGQGTRPFGEDDQSCKNISGAVATALSPGPNCWTCKEEAGYAVAWFILWDHQWVTCISHPSDGSKGEEIAFDYWSGNPSSVNPKTIRDEYNHPQDADHPTPISSDNCNMHFAGPDNPLAGVKRIPPAQWPPVRDPYDTGMPRGY